MPHVYPGLGGDLYITPSYRGMLYPMGVHPDNSDATSEMLLVREVAMMIVMDRLTDKPDWHLKVHDSEITKKWTAEALALPIEPLYEEITGDKDAENDENDENAPSYLPMKRLKTILSEKCMDYCIQELRRKAELFQRSGIIRTLDATAGIAKSDSLVDQELHHALQDSFLKLTRDQANNPDWHPGTNETVQDLVHPSLYPLVYGRTRVLSEELVGVVDAVDKWAGTGEPIPPINEHLPEEFLRYGRSGRENFGEFWSNKFQWLPANVAFQDDGTVRFTSYVNNLHPKKFPDVYRALEKLIAKAIPMWDQCLGPCDMDNRQDRGQIRPGSFKPRFPQPPDTDDNNPLNWNPTSPEGLPPMSEEEAAFHENSKKLRLVSREPRQPYSDTWERNWFEYHDTVEEARFHRLREPVQPEPPAFEPRDYSVNPAYSLRNLYASTGLQVIVKMASIELTPDKPEFSGGGWHIEGQMNEHIVGTALYYLDSENVTESQLKFRMPTSYDQLDHWSAAQNAFEWMEAVFGTDLGSDWAPCLQNYGSVVTRQGRLLAFPNVFQHRVSPFRLEDPMKPGHRRFVALWLVDPTTRIINTGNVPPQQADWWLESAVPGIVAGLGSAKSGSGRSSSATRRDIGANMPPEAAQIILENYFEHEKVNRVVRELGPMKFPPELMNAVRMEMGDLPISGEEAKKYRDELMEVRKKHDVRARDTYVRYTYSFCEH